MKTKKKILIILAVIFLHSVHLVGQEKKGARYQVVLNSLLDIIDANPEKKESIEQTIHSTSPNFVDFFLVDDDVIQIYWGYQNNLMGIKVYSKKGIYSISADNILQYEKRNTEIDSINFKWIDNKNNMISYYELTEKGATPTNIILKDKLKNDNFSKLALYNNYPEISVLINLKVFPETFVFGRPKPLMTYFLKNYLTFELFDSEQNYSEFIDNINSSDIRQLLIEKISP